METMSRSSAVHPERGLAVKPTASTLDGVEDFRERLAKADWECGT